MSKTFSKVVVTLGLAASLLVPAIAHGQTSTTTTSTTSTTSVATTSYPFTRDLTIGSRGNDVVALQQILIAKGFLHIAAPTGYFGTLTKAAVGAWQLSVGLNGLGYFGPLSRAKMAAMAVVVYPAGCTSASGYSTVNGASCITVTTTTTTSSYPAGCTSTSGFSTTTGGRCDAPMPGLPAGCTSTAGYSPTTGVKCDSGSPLPAGCTSTAGYSQTTGIKCDTVATTTTTSTTTTTTTTTAANGAGSVEDYKLLSTPANNREVGEDENDVKVIGISVTADEGSDLNFTALRVEFCNDEVPVGNCDGIVTETANQDLDNYADDVSIWMGNKEVARVDASTFTSDNDFSRTITLNGALVGAGDTENFYVALSGVSNLDSNDDGETWSADVTSMRFVDAQAAVISENPNTGSRTFTFETFATASDLELKLAEATNNPDAQVVDVSATSSTDGVLLLSGTLKAIGSDIDVKEMNVVITPTGTGDASEIASEYTLEIDGVEVQSLASNACTVLGDCDGTGTSTAVTYNFDDVDVNINEGDTVTVRVLANINPTTGSGSAEGDTLKASIDNDDTVAEDQTGEDLIDADTTGTLTGEQQSFFANGIRVAVGTHTTEIAATDTAADSVTFTWGITVSAFGDNDVYINADVADVVEDTLGCDDTNASSSTDVDTVYSIEVSGTGDLDSCSGVISDTSDATEVVGSTGYTGSPYSAENFFKIVAGSSETFTITVSGTNDSNTVSKLVRALLTNIEWTADEVANTTATGAATINSYTFDLSNSSPTPWKTIQ